MTAEDITHRFTNHPPASPQVGFLLDEVTEYMTTVGLFIDERIPDSREKSLALTNLEQASFWCKAAIARNQPAIPGPGDAK